MTIYFCPNCTMVFHLPDELGNDVRAHTGDLARRRQRVAAIMFLVNASGEPPALGLAEAKTIVQHIPDQLDICHICGSPLPERGVTHCTNCKAISLNW